MPLSPELYTWLVGAFAALGSIVFGYDLGVIASVLPSPNFRNTMGPRIEDSNQEGLVTSLLLLGAFFSCPFAGYFANRYGRRWCILGGSLIFMLGASLQTGARNIDYMMAGRFFAGAGIGWLSFLAPLYQSEIAQPSIRGALSTLQQFALGIGALVASWVGFGTFKNYTDARQWRLPLSFQLIPVIPLAALIFVFPESPRWLALKGRNEEALATLARLHAHGNIDDPLVNFEFEDIKASIKAANHEHLNPWKELFTKSHHFRPLALGCILQFSVQMTGVSALQYYSPLIFANLGYDSVQTLRFQSYNSIIALGGELACILLVDRLGRRWPLIIGNLVSCATYAVATALYALYPAPVDNTSAHLAFVMMTWIFNLAFSSCIGPLSWAYPVEILPTHLRAQGTAITSCFAWCANFLVGQVTPIAFRQRGWQYYIAFCVMSFTNAVTIWAFFPETKGRRLEEMEDLFKYSSWFVPSHPPRVVNAKQVEEEMREGRLEPGHATEHGTGQAFDSPITKAEDEKVEHA